MEEPPSTAELAFVAAQDALRAAQRATLKAQGAPPAIDLWPAGQVVTGYLTRETRRGSGHFTLERITSVESISVCSLCGALVSPHYSQKHIAWHISMGA